MATHELKCWPEFFVPLRSGEKTAELRYNDRDYQVGDILILREWEPKTESYSGRSIQRRVSHVLHGVGTVGAIAPLRGLSAKYVMMSLQYVDEHLRPEDEHNVFERTGRQADREVARHDAC